MKRWMIALCASVGFHATAAASQILVVDAAGAGPFKTIQAAVDAAASGDTILAKPAATWTPFASQSQRLLVEPPFQVLVLGAFATDGTHVVPFANPPSAPAWLGLTLHVRIATVDTTGALNLGGPSCAVFVQ